MQEVQIDINKLRQDLVDDSLGAAFVGGFGGGFFEASDVKKASPEELIEMARNKGFNLNKYII